MLRSDRIMGDALLAHWLGVQLPVEIKLCPLLADVDRMLAYFDEIGLKPGYALNPCPECGADHRWAMLKWVLSNALTVRPAGSSRLLQMVDDSLTPVRALYGGEEGYREMLGRARAFFDSVGRTYWTGEVIRTPEQIEAERLKAIRRNTHPSRSKKLRTFLDDELPGRKNEA